MKKYSAIFLMLVGCAVSPLYQQDKPAESHVYVDVIAERDGQQLRRYLKNNLRDIPFSSQKYRLTVTLKTVERQFAEMTDESAQRVEIRHIAHVILRNSGKQIVFEDDIIAASSNNISSGHGDVIFSLYGRNNRNLLKELSIRIVEQIRMRLENEKNSAR